MEYLAGICIFLGGVLTGIALVEAILKKSTTLLQEATDAYGRANLHLQLVNDKLSELKAVQTALQNLTAEVQTIAEEE